LNQTRSELKSHYSDRLLGVKTGQYQPPGAVLIRTLNISN
jgi:hypothetical protein